MHGVCGIGDARGVAGRYFNGISPWRVVATGGHACAEGGVGDERYPLPSLRGDGGADGHGVDVYTVTYKIAGGAWVGEDGFDYADGSDTGIGFFGDWEDIIEVGGVACAGVDGGRGLVHARSSVGDEGGDATFNEPFDDGDDVVDLGCDGHNSGLAVAGVEEVV